jgi:hypothetical protein
MVSFILNCICTIFIPIHPPHRAPTLEEQCRAVKRETGRPDHFQFCAALHTRVWTGFGIVSNETNNTKIYRGMGMRGFTCSSLSIQNWNVRGFVRSSLSQIWNVHALVDDRCASTHVGTRTRHGVRQSPRTTTRHVMNCVPNLCDGFRFRV